MNNEANKANSEELPKITIKKAANPAPTTEKPHPQTSVKKVIGVLSGKGGVGKSLITSLLAVNMKRLGYNTAILDADITGPSIPRAFGAKGQPEACETGMYPKKSSLGIDLMSINFLLPEDTDPVVWRGPVIGGAVKQFWTDVIWENEDYMFIDMPPGTGDVALTVFQSIPVDGIIVVTSPQELVGMIVEKAVKMAGMMDIPVLGLVENMSYVKCPCCDEKFSIYGESHIDEIAAKYGVKVVSKLPFDMKLASLCDTGKIEEYEENNIPELVDLLKTILPL